MDDETTDMLTNVFADTLGSVFHSDSQMTPNGYIGANVVDGLFAIASGLNRVAGAIDRLGVNNAATDMGAIEVLARNVSEGLASVANAVQESSD